MKESPGPVSDEELSSGVVEDSGFTDDEDCAVSDVPEERPVLPEDFAPSLDVGVASLEEESTDSELSGSSGVFTEVESVQAVIAKENNAARGRAVLNKIFFFIGKSPPFNIEKCRERVVSCFPLKTGNALEGAPERGFFRYILGMIVYKNVFCAGAALAAASLFTSAAFAAPLMNQLGFYPDAEKTVVYPGNDANGLEVRDLNGKTVLKLDAPDVYDWEYSGEEVQTFDISAIKTP